MPPKETQAKKPTVPITRPPISDSSLLYVPNDAVEGYRERLETGINWTLLEEAGRHHKQLCQRSEIPELPFSIALLNKIKKSILNGFLDQENRFSLQEQWEILLPMTLWDIEKFANKEGTICFNSINCITDDMIKIIKRAVRADDRELLRQDLINVSTLRVTDSQMTKLDQDLIKFKRLVTLNLCGNFIGELDASLIPDGIRVLELQANRISNIEHFAEYLPPEILYLGLARNLITNEFVDALARLPRHISVLDLADNDIYHLEPLLKALAGLPCLTSLQLAGNPCSVCAAYARTTLMRLPSLQWLDSRKTLPTDRSLDPTEPHPHDLRSSYFNFSVFRVMSVPQPPKPEKGAIATFHVELELPLLDSTRRLFLMFRKNESLTELLPPPEDDDWTESKVPSVPGNSNTTLEFESSTHDSDIYNRLMTKNSREIYHYTTFESNRVQWNKMMTFQEPAVRIFCPDLTALRDTFRSVITLRLVYTLTTAVKQGKADKKSAHSFKGPLEQRVILATIKCPLKRVDWSQSAQHFHWDDTLRTDEALHWGDGDLSILQYTQAAAKPVPKGKADADVGSSRQIQPENLTCHFGFGIHTIRS